MIARISVPSVVRAVHEAGRPHDRLAMVDSGTLVAHLDVAATADDDEQRRVGLVRVRRDDRVALEGKLADQDALVAVDDDPGYSLRAGGPSARL
jgi:hypothetical protein